MFKSVTDVMQFQHSPDSNSKAFSASVVNWVKCICSVLAVVDSKVFRWWYITLRITEFFKFGHHLAIEVSSF
jgi:hypothetical protein